MMATSNEDAIPASKLYDEEESNLLKNSNPFKEQTSVTKQERFCSRRVKQIYCLLFLFLFIILLLIPRNNNNTNNELRDQLDDKEDEDLNPINSQDTEDNPSNEDNDDDSVLNDNEGDSNKEIKEENKEEDETHSEEEEEPQTPKPELQDVEKEEEEEILTTLSPTIESGSAKFVPFYSVPYNCTEYLSKSIPDNDMKGQVILANCGTYKFPSKESAKKSWKVVFYGPSFLVSRTRILSGCPTHCPLNPHCHLSFSDSLVETEHANVVVVFQDDYHLLMRGLKAKIRVIYWREAHKKYVPLSVQVNHTEFEMGIHYDSQILNPGFLLTPIALNGKVQNKSILPKSKLAISVASDCTTLSKREDYLAQLKRVVNNRVDAYGDCGDYHLVGQTIEQGRRQVEQYKFYFSFENTIQAGYVTEKLFHVLSLNIVPVYYGGANPPNITKTPSYINAADFSSPEQLGKYLLYLNEHDEEYMKYHEWRKHPTAFDLDYLKKVQRNRPSIAELAAHKDIYDSPRAAVCCRLCNSEFVEDAIKRRKYETPNLVESPRKGLSLRKMFYGGKP